MAEKSMMPARRYRPGFLTGNGGMDPFRSLHRQMDRLFSEFSQDLHWPRFEHGAEMAMPLVDVAETDDGLTVTAELPGMEEKDIEVDLTQNVLTLKGEKKAETEEKKADYHFRERSYGSFARSVAVPFDVDPDTVQAAFSKGVLTITLPRPAEAKRTTRKIEVKPAG